MEVIPERGEIWCVALDSTIVEVGGGQQGKIVPA